ncbi:hypothetical protein X975_00925, partial [Stegodyphus mimosarum]
MYILLHEEKYPSLLYHQDLTIVNHTLDPHEELLEDGRVL